MNPGLHGLIELNALFLLAGLGILVGLRGLGTLVELVDSLALAYVLGLASVCVLATLLLVVGTGIPPATVATCALALFVVGATVALVRRRPLPSRLGRLPRPTLGTIAALACVGSAIAVLVALFRYTQIVPLGGGDSWEFWVPKAKIIYFDHGIDNGLFTSYTGGRYPLLVPALLAMDFGFMHSADAPEVAFQYWLVYAAFVFAAGSILARLVAPWLAWLFAAVTAVIPNLDTRVLDAQADWTLDLLFALSALLALSWLRTGEGSQLACAGIVLAAVIATKQEGLLLAACLGLGVLAATIGRWRRVWPRALATGLLAYAVNLPWRFWWGDRNLPAAVPTSSVSQLLHDVGRVWPSISLVLRLLFSSGEWLWLVPLALGAALACLTRAGAAREVAVAYLVTCVIAVGAFTWILWTEASLPLTEAQSATPIPRVVGSIVLLSSVVAPLLVDPLLRSFGRDAARPTATGTVVGTAS